VAEDGTPIAASFGGVYYKSVLNWVQVPGVNPADTITVIGIGGSGFLENTGDDDGLVLGAISGNIYSGTIVNVLLICWLGAEIAGFILEEGLNLAGVYSPFASQGGAFELPLGLPVNDGLPSVKPLSAFDDTESASTLKAIAGFFYNAVDGAKIYTREFVTAVEGDNSEIPQNFSLAQNYPNPFNPSTNIEYSIPTESFVELMVYDVLGNEVASLVNEQQIAGVYRADFTADNLPSGMYFARLTANEFTQVVKMILMK
jgi:hypothetical protein